MSKAIDQLRSTLSHWFSVEFIAQKMSLYTEIRHKAYSYRTKIVFVAVTLYMIYLTTLTSTFITSTQPFYPDGSTPEQILEYTAAKNYVDYGFFKYGLLADYGSSPNAKDHPYLYTHQPSLPAVLLGVLLKLDLSLVQARLFFSGISLLGCLAFFMLVLKITRVPEIAFLSLILFSLDFEAFIKWSDHFVHSFSNLTYFGTLYFYLAFLDKKNKAFFYGFGILFSLGLLTNFISAIPCFIALLIFHFSLHRSQRESKNLVIFAIISSVFWATMILGRNCVVLGLDIAIKDLLYTLGNRSVGWPQKSEIKSFFDAHHIVLWGVDIAKGGDLKQWLRWAISAPLKDFDVYLAFLLLASFSLKWKVNDFVEKLKYLLIVFACCYAWHILFFAQGSIYQFPPIHRMSRMAFTIASLYLFYNCAREHFQLSIKNPRFFDHVRLIGFVTLLFCIGFLNLYSREQIKFNLARLSKLEKKDFNMKVLRSYNLLKNLPPGTIMTNIDGVVASFFTKNLVFGGCSNGALKELDFNGCPSSFIKHRPLGKPRYILLSRNYIPGYQRCHNECTRDFIVTLQRNHQVLMKEPQEWSLLVIE